MMEPDVACLQIACALCYHQAEGCMLSLHALNPKKKEKASQDIPPPRPFWVALSYMIFFSLNLIFL
jgi:hypothetical protein